MPKVTYSDKPVKPKKTRQTTIEGVMQFKKKVVKIKNKTQKKINEFMR